MTAGIRSFTRAAVMVAALLLSLLVSSAHAAEKDTVLLVTGELLAGKVLRMNEKEVSIKLQSGGIITFKSNHVSKIRRWVPGRDMPEVVIFDTQPPRDVDSGSDSRPGSGDVPVLRPMIGGDVIQAVKHEAPRDWYFEPPPGFEVAPPDKHPEAERVWIDPVVQAKVVLSAHSVQAATPEQLRLSTIAELGALKDTRIVRDQALERGGDGGYRGWILELEHTVTGRPVRQIELYTRARNRTFVLSYTCPIADYPSLARFFEESLESFRMISPIETSKDAPGRPSRGS